jgi:GNAT superfamily N-acetyltransferase
VSAPRPAADAEVPALARVINRAYTVEAFFVVPPRTTEDELRARLAEHGGAFLVVDDDARDGELAGAVYVEPRGARGYFGMLSVDPERQGRGLGRALVAAAEAWCRGAGCRFVDISVVNVRTELPAFYAALGYAPFDLAPFPDPQKLVSGARAHVVLMTKPLAPIWDAEYGAPHDAST